MAFNGVNISAGIIILEKPSRRLKLSSLAIIIEFVR